MHEFYLFTLLTTLILLVLWQTLSKVKGLSKLLGTLFLFSIIAYAVSIFQLHLQNFYSLKIVFRDLLLLSFASLVSVMARRTFIGAFSWLIISSVSIYFLFQNIQVLIPKDYSLDENAELFIKTHTPDPINSESFLDLVANENITYDKAFDVSFAETTELDNYYTLNLERDNPVYINDIKKKLEQIEEIELIEENEEIYVFPLFEEQRKPKSKSKLFNDPLSDQQWALEALKVEELSELIEQTGNSSQKAKLFILDTGVDSKHEDIAANYESVNARYDNDPQSHGTHCAGIAAAVCNNKKGVSSMAISNDLFTVTGIKVLNDMGIGNQKKIINGMIEAAENGADVISMSLGGRSTDKRQSLYNETVKYVNSLGSIVVVAAGNSSMNAKDYSPANTKGVIAVSAVDQNLQLATFSNTVEDLEMGISAPGVNILSTTPKNEYKAFNGTSMATPYVSGLISILKHYNPDLTTTEAYEIINESGRDIAQSRSGNFIDPANALKRYLGKK